MTGEVFQPRVSIILPAHNEEEDIRLCLDALAGLHYPNREVIVVDDASTDRTAETVTDFVRQGRCRLIQLRENQGAAAARNAGAKTASGEILVFLNADVVLSPDYLDRIVPHYDGECDYLVVESRVANRELLFPRFIEAEHHFLYDGQTWINWSEGFSCRKAAAFAVGLFPEKMPGAAGEDAVFGEALEKQFRKVIDRSIVVDHIAPHTLGGYWRQRLGRGRGISYRKHYVDGATAGSVLILCLKWTAREFLATCVVVPVARQALRLARFSPRGGKDRLPFFFVHFIQRWGTAAGLWLGLFRILSRRESSS